MKIVYFLSSIARRGGVERTLIDKANYLGEHGHSVTIVTYEQSGNPVAYELSPAVQHVDLNIPLYTIYRYRLPLREWRRMQMKRQLRTALYSLVERLAPDVLVATTYESAVLGAVMSVRRLTRIVLESHIASQYDTFSGVVKGLYNYLFALRPIRRCDLLIALTEGDAAFWRKYVKHVKVVPNPVSFYDGQLADVAKEGGRIIAVGRLHRQKRFDRLVEAFALIAGNHPEWHVDIYGEGGDRDALQRQIDAYGLHQRIVLRGNTQHIREEYMKSQFFVLSSDFEGFGLVVLEAMGCGLPVVSTDCPYGPSDIIHDGDDGLLCGLTAESLAEKMEWMMTHEADCKAMGRKAHLSVARYQLERVMPEWESAYMSVLP